MLDLVTASFENGYLFTQRKENTALIKDFVPMYINFDEYSPYSSTISENFETNVNANIQCDYSYAYASSQ